MNEKKSQIEKSREVEREGTLFQIGKRACAKPVREGITLSRRPKVVNYG